VCIGQLGNGASRQDYKLHSLVPFFFNAVEKGRGAFVVVFSFVKYLVEGTELLDIVLRWLLIVCEE
jgi:hypothetical protein